MKSLISSLILAAAAFAQIGSMTIRDLTGAGQPGRVVSFGRVFAKGQLPRFAQPTITAGGRTVLAQQFQNDIRNRYPDGSIRFGVFTWVLDLPANGAATVAFVDTPNPCHLGDQITCDAAALKQSQMLDRPWNATIEIASDAVTQAASARSLLEGGHFKYWLRGPLLTQVIVEDLGKSADIGVAAATSRGLHPQFILSFFPSTVGEEFILENMWASQLVNQRYALVLKNGAGNSNIAYAHDAFTHYAQARWHRGNPAAPIYDGPVPAPIEVNHNIAHIVDARALPNFDVTLPANYSKALTSYNASNRGDEFGEAANIMTAMGTTGSRPDIAPVHQTQYRALASGVAAMDAPLYFYGDVAAHIPVHLREDRTDNRYCPTACVGPNAMEPAYGKPVSAQGRPTLDASSFSKYPTAAVADDRIVLAGPATQSTWTFDIGHHPSLAYAPYLVTGSYFLYEEMQFWAEYTLLVIDPGYRGYEWSVNNHRIHQWRGAAWQLRTIGQAAYTAVDGSSERDRMMKQLDWAAAAWEGAYGITDGNFPPVTTSCSAYAGPSTGPTKGPDRSLWNFGYCWLNKAKENPLRQHIGQQSGNCQKDYWGRFDCLKVSANEWAAPWMIGYWMIAAGWINEAVSPAFSKVLDVMGNTYAKAVAEVPDAARVRMLGGLYNYWGPTQRADGTYFTNWPEYQSAMVKDATTSTTSAISPTSTVFTVADWSALTFGPMWRRTAADIQSITADANVITIVFRKAHGLSVGHRILTANHSVAGLNTNSGVTGSAVSVRTVLSAPTPSSLTFAATAPVADGTYDVEPGFISQTPRGALKVKVGAEVINICAVDPDGTVVVGAGAQNDNTSATGNGACVPDVSQRGQNGTVAGDYPTGTSAASAFDVWPDAGDAAGGYAWIERAAASYAPPSVWTWLETNLFAVWGKTFTAAAEPVWSIRPRIVQPAAPTSVFTQTSSTGAVEVNWTDTANPSGTSYFVYRAEGPCKNDAVFGKVTADPVRGAKFTDSPQTQGARYCYRVTAFRNTESLNSNEAEIVLSAPEGLTITVPNTVKLIGVQIPRTP